MLRRYINKIFKRNCAFDKACGQKTQLLMSEKYINGTCE